MPEVEGRHFAYSKKGKRAAEVFRNRLESKGQRSSSPQAPRNFRSKSNKTHAFENFKVTKNPNAANKEEFEAKREALKRRLMGKHRSATKE